jgi:hypothetical protein
MRGGDEGFYRSCLLRKGHPFKLRHDSVKFPRTGHCLLAQCLGIASRTSEVLHLAAGRTRGNSADYAEDLFITREIRIRVRSTLLDIGERSDALAKVADAIYATHRSGGFSCVRSQGC